MNQLLKRRIKPSSGIGNNQNQPISDSAQCDALETNFNLKVHEKKSKIEFCGGKNPKQTILKTHSFNLI